MPTTQKRSTSPARVTPKPKAREVEMFEAVSEINEDGEVDVLIFGEPFTISTDVNGWLLLLAGSGSSRDVVNLVRSILVVSPSNGENIEIARQREEVRFNTLLGGRKNFSVENAVELVNALTEVAAGNEA
jgi:hypothetical protein